MTGPAANRQPRPLVQLLEGILPPGTVGAEQVSGLTLDSRAVEPGSLFVACRGTLHHGLNYLPQAVSRGAVAVLCEPDDNFSVADIQALGETVAAPLYPVVGLRDQVSLIAGRFYGHPGRQMTLIGVTGTNGKTSCCHFLSQAFSPEHLCAVIGTVGNGLPGALERASHTTPDAISLQSLLADLHQRGADMVAMEVSSHALDQGRAAALPFNLAVLTNLSQDHLDYHDSMDAYARAKQRLFCMPGLEAAVLNMDDPFSSRLLAGLPAGVRVVGYSCNDGTALELEQWVRASHIMPEYDGLALTIESSWGSGQLKSGLLGHFNVSNLLAVLAVLLERGIAFDAALGKLSELTTVSGRMQRFGGAGQPLVVVDYAHTPDALEHALKALQAHVGGRLVCVFGCGGDRDRGKRPLMGAVAEQYADKVIVTDDNPRTEAGDRIVEEILAGISERAQVEVIRQRDRAIEQAIREAVPGDLVLVAGKGHEDYQLVGHQVLRFSDQEQVEQCLAEVWP